MAAEEIELLEAMFPDELTIKENNKLEITLRPRTDLNSSQGIFVFITLSFILPEGYPDNKPAGMEIRNARGIDEEGTTKLLVKLRKKADELVGSPAVYELIQLARDLLTENNRPHEDCPICLIAFEDTEEFVKTPCFHYFHIDCFMSYCQSSVGDLRCPLCRELLSGDFLSTVIGQSDSLAPPPPVVETPVEPPRPPTPPAEPVCPFLHVTNLGNERKLDWQGMFDNVYKLYGAISVTLLTQTTALVEFNQISAAEIALVNTDKTTIGGQKISCKFASGADWENYKIAKQNAELQSQIQLLSLQNKELEQQKQEQLKTEQQQQSNTTSQDSKHNKDNKFKNRNPKPPRLSQPLRPPPSHAQTAPTTTTSTNTPHASSHSQPHSPSHPLPHPPVAQQSHPPQQIQQPSRPPPRKPKQNKPNNNVKKREGGSDAIKT